MKFNNHGATIDYLRWRPGIKYWRIKVDNEYIEVLYQREVTYTLLKSAALRIKNDDLGDFLNELKKRQFNMSLITAEPVTYLTVNSEVWKRA